MFILFVGFNFFWSSTTCKYVFRTPRSSECKIFVIKFNSEFYTEKCICAYVLTCLLILISYSYIYGIICKMHLYMYTYTPPCVCVWFMYQLFEIVEWCLLNFFNWRMNVLQAIKLLGTFLDISVLHSTKNKTRNMEYLNLKTKRVQALLCFVLNLNT